MLLGESQSVLVRLLLPCTTKEEYHDLCPDLNKRLSRLFRSFRKKGGWHVQPWSCVCRTALHSRSWIDMSEIQKLVWLRIKISMSQQTGFQPEEVMSSILQQLKTCYSFGNVQNVMQKQRFLGGGVCVCVWFLYFFLFPFWFLFFAQKLFWGHKVLIQNQKPWLLLQEYRRTGKKHGAHENKLATQWICNI